jgi:hypothetical protein
MIGDWEYYFLSIDPYNLNELYYILTTEFACEFVDVVEFLRNDSDISVYDHNEFLHRFNEAFFGFTLFRDDIKYFDIKNMIAKQLIDF